MNHLFLYNKAGFYILKALFSFYNCLWRYRIEWLSHSSAVAPFEEHTAYLSKAFRIDKQLCMNSFDVLTEKIVWTQYGS